MYKTSDVATITGIHPNTVRFYEKLGLISPVPRSEKGYRIFDEGHLIQVKVLRCIFLDDWPGEAIRRASMNIVEALKVWDIATALQCSRLHQKIIEKEGEKAWEAMEILRKWSEKQAEREGDSSVGSTGQAFSRKEAAAIIGVTPEALRNWERNDLISIPRQGQHHTRVYGPREMERLKVIYLLRQSRFSLSAIHRCLTLLDTGRREEALVTLKHPDKEEVVWTGDQWLAVLEKTMEKAREIEKILARCTV